MENEREKIILSPHGEQFDLQYGKLDYTNKVVLDIGAYIGDSVSYFLRRGAIKIIAVDKNIVELSKNYQDSNIVEIIELEITNPIQLAILIEHYKPNIIKLDCEGAEAYLLGIPPEILRIPEAYTMEIHKFCGITPERFEQFFKEAGRNICEKNGFEVEFIFDPKWQAEGITSGLYARRIGD